MNYNGHFGFVNFDKSFLFAVKCLETWLIYCQGLRVYLHCLFLCAIQTEAIAAIFYHRSSVIGITYWKQVCQICAHLVTASAEGCLSACTVFFQDATKIQNSRQRSTPIFL